MAKKTSEHKQQRCVCSKEFNQQNSHVHVWVINMSFVSELISRNVAVREEHRMSITHLFESTCTSAFMSKMIICLEIREFSDIEP